MYVCLISLHVPSQKQMLKCMQDCNKTMSKKKIQPTLFAFGVTKKVKHREEVVNVSLTLRAEEQI